MRTFDRDPKEIKTLQAEVERLRAGYLWLEGLAEGRQIVISVDPVDGTLEISKGIYRLYEHVDLADLCIRQAAEAEEEPKQ